MAVSRFCTGASPQRLGALLEPVARARHAVLEALSRAGLVAPEVAQIAYRVLAVP